MRSRGLGLSEAQLREVRGREPQAGLERPEGDLRDRRIVVVVICWFVCDFCVYVLFVLFRWPYYLFCANRRIRVSSVQR